MIVSDIYGDLQEVLGMCSEKTVFSRTSDAVEMLANKANWDVLQGYITLPVTGNLVTLPPDVETPIKVNIDNKPAFSRGKLFEFTLNGPGSDTERVDWSWEDRGTISVLRQPLVPARLVAKAETAADNGKKLSIRGKPMPSGLEVDPNAEIEETVEITYVGDFSGSGQLALSEIELLERMTVKYFSSVTHVSKDATIGKVSLEGTGNIFLSVYAPRETEPAYRQIRLSKSGATAYILFRRSVFRITSQDDFIPMQSRMALLMMLEALKKYRNGDMDGKAFEEVSTRLALEEEKSRNAFAEVAAATEIDSDWGLNYNNRDSVIVADVYDDVCRIVGKIGQPKVFDKITEARQALMAKGQWDGTQGYIDICTDSSCFVTLPRYVDAILALNLNGSPTTMRSQWFEFSLDAMCGRSCGAWTELGSAVTFRDLRAPQRLVAIPELAADNGKTLRVFGHDEDDTPIRSLEDGKYVDGYSYTLNTAHVVPLLTSPRFARITRIFRDETKGFVTLEGFDDNLNAATRIGFYYPDETEPNYRRIKLPSKCAWVRIRYRTRTQKITSLTDPLHLKSKLAIVRMVKAIALFDGDKYAEAEKAEMKALQALCEEQSATHPLEIPEFKVEGSFGGSNFVA